LLIANQRGNEDLFLV